MILAISFLRGSSPDAPLVWCVLGLGAGVYLFFHGFRLLQKRRLILDTPVSKIRSASLGMVELQGLAVGPYTTIAPITERPCYYYRTEVWEWKRCGRNNQWVKVAAECVHLPFFLDDNTGKVMVDPRGAELDLHRDFQQEFSDSLFTTKEEVPASVHSFLSRHGVSTTNKIKVEESCIKPKNSLFVLGTLDENPGLELTPQPIREDESLSTFGGTSFSVGQITLSPIFAEGSGLSSILGGGLQHDPAFDPIYDKAASTLAARVVRLSPDPGPEKAADMTQQQKVAAALMKAGIMNPAAWQAAGVTNSSSPAENGNATGPADAFDPRPPVVLMKGKNNPTFMISWRSQRDLARSLGWKCALMIWGGPALALLSLYGLLNFKHLL